MLSQNHSPLPWRRDGVVIRDAKGRRIFTVSSKYTTDAEDTANAAIVVAAANTLQCPDPAANPNPPKPPAIFNWENENDRRCALIDKDLREGLTLAESAELDRLQHRAELFLQLVAPYPLQELADLVAKLKAKGQWNPEPAATPAPSPLPGGEGQGEGGIRSPLPTPAPSPMGVLSKHLRVTMPDGSIWNIPVRAIAHLHSVWAQGEFHMDYVAALQQKTVPLFNRGDHEIIALANNNMNWSDLAEAAVLHSPGAGPMVSYQTAWPNAPKQIITPHS